MAAPQSRAKDPLDALQLLVNDVLIQTGKALRASRRDGHGNVAAPQGALQARLPETIKAFHAALDDLESDIIRAKSVLLRDLNELQSQRAKTNPSENPQKLSIDQHSRSPTGMDLASSPAAAHRDHSIKPEPAVKPVAPFPDMGMSLPDGNQSSGTVKEENAASQVPPAASGIKVESTTPSNTSGTMPAPDANGAGDHNNGSGGQEAMNLNSGLNFTDMEFTLAPTNNESQDQPVGDASNMNMAGDPSFDLASFAPADGNENDNNGNNMNTLDGIVPSNLNAPMNAPVTTDTQGKPGEQKSGDMQDSTFADIFTGDGQADGMDFDFSLGDGGMGGDTFDDLMNDRDSTFNTLEHGDFDATFFGLDKADGA
ncbi:hypothetical protein HIM_04493 [Hirsutella minnesotensis 3608]|uniref:Uncharacterized protein n=1 Tax=Hirsutella minnesotensis 3608 TaxID=1043627 RepID=A0A0F8A1A2_9HYPO|nr:hypothetical protein HIM_04493 [Hirsutella minnesotensis 3608]